MVELNIEFPVSFFEDEIRCQYKVNSKMKQVWAVELDLLKKLLDVCKQYNIKIFASGGTLLGAIRHKGMIPWDDDIDMMMFREDYNKLCNIASKEFTYPYFFQTEYTDPGSLRGHAQLRNSETTAILLEEATFFNQGIFIDIFPLDSVIDDEILFEEQYKEAEKYRVLAWKYSGFSTRYIKGKTTGLKGKVKDIIFPITNFIIRSLKMEERAYSKFEKICQRYNNLNTKFVSTLSLQFMNKQHFKYRCDFSKVMYVPFEFIDIPIGTEYDHALRQRFGDYMKFVKGTSYHGNIMFDTENSYKKYLIERRKL